MELSYWGISPNIPAWPTDENGEREQAVLLAHTFDSPADADVTISLLTAYGIPCFKYYDKAVSYTHLTLPTTMFV